MAGLLLCVSKSHHRSSTNQPLQAMESINQPWAHRIAMETPELKVAIAMKLKRRSSRS